FRVTLRRLDLAAEIYHIREPQKIPLVMSPDETKRLLAVAQNLKVRVLLSLGYGCGLRAGEVVRLRSSISTMRRRSFALSNPKAARIATSCSRPRCSICCDNGGRCAGVSMPQYPFKNAGCFLVVGPASR